MSESFAWYPATLVISFVVTFQFHTICYWSPVYTGSFTFLWMQEESW